jgi:hypothetical protein
VSRIPGGRAVLAAIAEEFSVSIHFCELAGCGQPLHQEISTAAILSAVKLP